MVIPHDILCINGASAALMLSPLPFLGPVGAVRIGRIDGRARRQPDAARRSRRSPTLDLIVVGTKDGLTMVEAGADEMPEEKLLEALELAHAEIRKLCEAQEELRAQAGKPKWLDPELTAELENVARRARSAPASRPTACAKARPSVEEIVEEVAAALDGLDGGGHRR